MSSAWSPGQIITWAYRNPRFPDLVDLRPVTVVADDDRHLALWLAPGTPVLRQLAADGRELRDLPGIGRFSAPRAQAAGRWRGPGLLAVLLPGRGWSAWLFEEAPGRRRASYVNIEAPFHRHAGGVESRDLVLDVVVDAHGRCRLKDEDELELAAEAGMFSPEEIAAIRRTAAHAIDEVEAGVFPFDGSYEDFRADPGWPVPELPAQARWAFDQR